MQNYAQIENIDFYSLHNIFNLIGLIGEFMLLYHWCDN